ncbi:molybdopterin-dependent oxidoreductase [uncultured Jatrophihabitans sp.]|uniref:molybdopterin-dependent oxidoreductase n=1 Tax=uncultured Jatrophihabitans sp. TaxID=1610747 RepID=UPI0035CA027C
MSDVPAGRPRVWPHFSSPLRSTALTARLGRVVGICFSICFVTGMLSHYQYHPWSWLPEPSAPLWGYRITQGLHVATGTILIPLLLVKLWSVYPNLFRWPPAKSAKHAIERLSVAVLVASALVELTTGFFNALNWYPWPWSFVPVHRFLAYVVVGSILLHIAVKLPDIKYGLKAKVADGDVLTEVPWEDNPHSSSNNDEKPPPPPTPEGISRRGVLTATGIGVGVIVLTSVGQTVTPLEPIGLLAIRQSKKGPAHVPVNRTADQAGVRKLAVAPDWQLRVRGPQPFALTLADIEQLTAHEASFPITCVEGWSVGAEWRGMKLIDIVRRAGGDVDSHIRLVSLEPHGSFNQSVIFGPQLSEALLATHLNGTRIDIDHGYPLRLIAPNRAGVLNTKWLKTVEVL